MALEDGDSVATAFPTQSGMKYDLSFFAAPSADFLQVSVGDLNTDVNDQSGLQTNIIADSLGPTYWRTYSMPFTATSTTSTLTITNIEENLQFGVISLDGIIVDLPEPTSLSLLLLGGEIMLRRSRRT